MVNADTIITWLIEQVSAKKVVGKDDWLEIAFKLNVLYLPEIEKLEDMRQKLAQRRFDIMKAQEKRNVAAASLEIETLDEFRNANIQEAKVEQIKEFIRIAKRNTDNL